MIRGRSGGIDTPPTWRGRYLQQLESYLDERWDESELEARIDEWEALLTPYADPGGTGEYAEDVDSLRAWIAAWRSAVEAELEGEAPEVSTELRDSDGICIEEIGSVEASFRTNWGTIGSDDFSGEGAASMEIALDTYELEVLGTGAIAGEDTDAGAALVGVAADISLGGELLCYVYLTEEALLSGGTVVLDGEDAEARLAYASDGAPSSYANVYYLYEGELVLEEAGTEQGSVVRGTLSSPIYGPVED